MKTIDGDDDSYDAINKMFDGRKCWRNADGQFHRDGDLPAVILADGALYYFKDNKRHREGGLPAVIWPDGSVEYYINGWFFGWMSDRIF